MQSFIEAVEESGWGGESAGGEGKGGAYLENNLGTTTGDDNWGKKEGQVV